MGKKGTSTDKINDTVTISVTVGSQLEYGQHKIELTCPKVIGSEQDGVLELEKLVEKMEILLKDKMDLHIPTIDSEYTDEDAEMEDDLDDDLDDDDLDDDDLTDDDLDDDDLTDDDLDDDDLTEEAIKKMKKAELLEVIDDYDLKIKKTLAIPKLKKAILEELY